MQRPNTMSLDAMQKIINSFRQVERKIDRLQDDFSAQSKTLNDLRVMVGSLNSGFQSPVKDEETRKHDKSRELSHGSLKRKVVHSPGVSKVNKAKSYEPMVAKSFATKRSLKVKKVEIQKKASGRGRSGKKNTNELEAAFRGRIYPH